MKSILSAHKLKVQISFLQRTSIADAQCQATKLVLTNFYILATTWGNRLKWKDKNTLSPIDDYLINEISKAIDEHYL